MALPAPLRGVVPPVCTPLDSEGGIDRASLARLVEHLIRGGVHGLFALGSTGEVVYLTDAQRRTVLDTVVTAAAGRVPVLAGVLDTTTPRVLEHARVAAEAGVDALVATAPFYTRTHPLEIAAHFRRIRSECGLPLFAYDIPVSVGTKLSTDLVCALALDGTLAGVKDSSGDEGGLRRLITALGGADRGRGGAPGFSVLTGGELTVDAALLAGADGVVPGLGNVDPDAYVRLHAAARGGDWTLASAEQERLVSLFAIADVGPEDRMGRSSSALGGFKAALRLLGVIEGQATAFPQIPLDATAVERVAELLADAGLGTAR
ncbi:dihydrodipicolinate synthase family protein [Streptomyces sp. DW26H14]|uniref:dihydrodipicolinate synthase family protein n=1 Tax=Streptomyces sp. DW26H14 TaxID=3435395 RepID=UPI00403D7624